MTPHPLEGPKLKIQRTNGHIADVSQCIIDFLEANPAEIFTDDGPGNGEQCIKVRAMGQPPAKIAVICGEVLYGLRSALDQLACALATQNGHSNVSDTYFPFAGSKDDFESDTTQRKIRKLSADAVSIMHKIGPYKGGNDLLWALNKLCNTDKHQMLIPMAATNLGSHLKLTGRPLGTFEHTFKAPRTWQPLDGDAVIFVYPAGMKFDGEVTVLRDVSFRAVAPVAGQPIATTLSEFVRMTEDIVAMFEDKFFEA